jgi:hypothetical protein
VSPISKVKHSKVQEGGANWLSRNVGKSLRCVTSQKSEGLDCQLRNITNDDLTKLELMSNYLIRTSNIGEVKGRPITGHQGPRGGVKV